MSSMKDLKSSVGGHSAFSRSLPNSHRPIESLKKGIVRRNLGSKRLKEAKNVDTTGES